MKTFFFYFMWMDILPARMLEARIGCQILRASDPQELAVILELISVKAWQCSWDTWTDSVKQEEC